jgi:S-adenosylmethionine:tRNA ribosyltransferase-isomerase
MTDLFSLDSYDYPLPHDRIARYPLDKRDQSKMLVVDRATRTFAHHTFAELPQFLSPNDVVVMNNTRVLPCRLYAKRIKPDGTCFTGTVALLFLHPVEKTNDDLPQWRVLMKPAKKLPVGTRIQLDNHPSTLTVTDYRGNGEGVVSVYLADGVTSVEDLLQCAGEMPIPPYLNRHAEASDTTQYQTVFAKVPGSQAAPTAGLHFTPEVLATLDDQGITRAEVTLTVSIGTFREVQTDNILNHTMDGEWYTVEAEAAQAITQAKAKGGKVLAIGTTVAKTLETVVKEQVSIVPQSGESKLFIYPGFEFKTVDRLLTNFHMPKSTLLMLVSAFADYDLMMAAYKEALAHNYRFYSYGDCMLIL